MYIFLCKIIASEAYFIFFFKLNYGLCFVHRKCRKIMLYYIHLSRYLYEKPYFLCTYTYVIEHMNNDDNVCCV